MVVAAAIVANAPSLRSRVSATDPTSTPVPNTSTPNPYQTPTTSAEITPTQIPLGYKKVWPTNVPYDTSTPPPDPISGSPTPIPTP